MSYSFCPLTIKEANRFVNVFHRHNKPVWGAKFAVGLMNEKELVGVALAGRPIARALDKKDSIEILRTCIKQGHQNANSKLYARVKRICQLMGYNSIITYTLKDEKQSSLKAIGAVQVGLTKPKEWNTPSRRRAHQDIYLKEKIRWELNTNEVKGAIPPNDKSLGILAPIL